MAKPGDAAIPLMLMSLFRVTINTFLKYHNNDIF